MNTSSTSTIWAEYEQAGLRVIPVNEKKEATVKWGDGLPPFTRMHINGRAAILCGSRSGNVEVIDFDLKNCPGRDLMTEYFAVDERIAAIYKKLVVQTTVSGGFHFIYRCSTIGGNQKLAVAKRKPQDTKELVLIETRGEGGFVVCAPTPGYKEIQGSLLDVPEITPDERDILVSAARQLNEKTPEVFKPKFTEPVRTGGLTPWEDFDQRGEVDDLLQLHGWRYQRKVGDNLHYTRPDKESGTSATWSESKRLFYVFTSSTQFENDKAYPASAVFAYLECGKDFSEAARKLREMNYGDSSTNSTAKEVVSDWRRFQITSEPPEAPPVISIGNNPVATLGNYSQVIGKKKSRKTLFMCWLVGQYQGDIEKEVLVFDTEQGQRHVWKFMDRIKRFTGCTVGTFYLRGKTPAERRAIIQTVVAEYPTRPKLIVIDGIRDLLSDINDMDQVSEVLTWLEKLTLENSLHVVNVLHMNKTDNNARGHLGSELLNKSEITIELERDEQADCTVVKCESSRDIPFEPFAFRHNPEGLPEILGMPSGKGKVLPEEEKKSRIRFLFNEGQNQIKYAELIEAIKVHFSVGTSKAKQLHGEFCRQGWVVSNGKQGRDTFYKTMI